MLYTVKELSEKLHKNPETIRRWCRNGKVKSTYKSKKEGYIIEYNFEKEDKDVDVIREYNYVDIMKRVDWNDLFMRLLENEQFNKTITHFIEIIKEEPK